jgi:hypothetical protein
LEDGRFAAGKRKHERAGKRMEKARAHAETAKSLRGGKAGPSMRAIEKSLGAVAKALDGTKAKNQDKWPVGKPAAAQPAIASDQLAKAIAAIKAANEGQALLTANVQQLMEVVGGQSRNGSEPPVAALFKGDVLSFAGKPEAEINMLVTTGQITMAERDKAVDALATLKTPGMPAPMIQAMIDACPSPVQAVLKKAA